MPGGDPLATCALPVGVVYLLTYCVVKICHRLKRPPSSCKLHMRSHGSTTISLQYVRTEIRHRHNASPPITHDKRDAHSRKRKTMTGPHRHSRVLTCSCTRVHAWRISSASSLNSLRIFSLIDAGVHQSSSGVGPSTGECSGALTGRSFEASDPSA